MNKFQLFQKTSKRKFLKILGVSFLGSIGYGIYNKYSEDAKKSNWAGNVLGVPSKVELHSNSTDLNNYMTEEIERLVVKYENIFYLQNEQSEICSLNKNKFLENPSSEIRNVIEKSKFISLQTNGAFDITVQPLWELYFEHFILKNNTNPPDPLRIETTLNRVNWKNVIVSDNHIALENDASITLNGIAQGWITDQIKSLLAKNGYNNTLVDFGESYASGLFERKRPWNILIKGENTARVVELSNKAVATSAGYGTSFEPNSKYHHIFNTRDGSSSNNFRAVSIISDKAWLSDSVSTASLSMSEKEIKTLSKALKFKAYIQKENNFLEIS